MATSLDPSRVPPYQRASKSPFDWVLMELPWTDAVCPAGETQLRTKQGLLSGERATA
jgi:hypothetical protein